MAGLTKEQRAERAAAKAAEDEAAKLAAEAAAKAAEDGSGQAGNDVDDANDGLIAVCKGGESLRVHPSCLGAHISAGWSLPQ